MDVLLRTAQIKDHIELAIHMKDEAKELNEKYLIGAVEITDELSFRRNEFLKRLPLLDLVKLLQGQEMLQLSE